MVHWCSSFSWPAIRFGPRVGFMQPWQQIHDQLLALIVESTDSRKRYPAALRSCYLPRLMQPGVRAAPLHSSTNRHWPSQVAATITVRHALRLDPLVVAPAARPTPAGARPATGEIVTGPAANPAQVTCRSSCLPVARRNQGSATPARCLLPQ
jgi:hypothetical protein